MDNIVNFLFDFLTNIHIYLKSLNVMNPVFLILLLAIAIWLFVTNRKVQRVIRDPLKKYDKEIKKKQKELDREKVSVRAYVEKEVEKVRQVRDELKAQVEEEIQNPDKLKMIKISNESQQFFATAIVNIGYLYARMINTQFHCCPGNPHRSYRQNRG